MTKLTDEQQINLTKMIRKATEEIGKFPDFRNRDLERLKSAIQRKGIDIIWAAQNEDESQLSKPYRELHGLINAFYEAYPAHLASNIELLIQKVKNAEKENDSKSFLEQSNMLEKYIAIWEKIPKEDVNNDALFKATNEKIESYQTWKTHKEFAKNEMKGWENIIKERENMSKMKTDLNEKPGLFSSIFLILNNISALMQKQEVKAQKQTTLAFGSGTRLLKFSKQEPKQEADQELKQGSKQASKQENERIQQTKALPEKTEVKRRPAPVRKKR